MVYPPVSPLRSWCWIDTMPKCLNASLRACASTALMGNSYIKSEAEIIAVKIQDFKKNTDKLSKLSSIKQ